ncbi:MAG: hypothetical protein ACU0BF_02290 [Paracoccaceae bacterium]
MWSKHGTGAHDDTHSTQLRLDQAPLLFFCPQCIANGGRQASTALSTPKGFGGRRIAFVRIARLRREEDSGRLAIPKWIEAIERSQNPSPLTHNVVEPLFGGKDLSQLLNRFTALGIPVTQPVG